jgi:hypothetical protein
MESIFLFICIGVGILYFLKRVAGRTKERPNELEAGGLVLVVMPVLLMGMAGLVVYGLKKLFGISHKDVLSMGLLFLIGLVVAYYPFTKIWDWLEISDKKRK